MVDLHKYLWVVMGAEIKLEGLDAVFNLLDEVYDPIALNQALGQACAYVEREAKKLAPKGNGDLRRSITSKVEGLEGVVFTPLEYAPYVEYGTGLFAEDGNGRKDVPWNYKDEKGEWHSTSGQKPHPFMRPALNNSRTQINQILKGAIAKND